MTALQWLYDQIGDYAPPQYAKQIESFFDEAFQMEKEQMGTKCNQPELSDDEIYDIAYNELHPLIRRYVIDAFIDGMKAYREQLKQRK